MLKMIMKGIFTIGIITGMIAIVVISIEKENYIEQMKVYQIQRNCFDEETCLEESKELFVDYLIVVRKGGECQIKYHEPITKTYGFMLVDNISYDKVKGMTRVRVDLINEGRSQTYWTYDFDVEIE